MARKPQVPGGEPAAEAEESQPDAAPQAEPGILRAADVDPTKLKRAVLTADGWVCPETSPAPPARQ